MILGTPNQGVVMMRGREGVRSFCSRLAVVLACIAAVVVAAIPVGAGEKADRIVLEGASSAEGITVGRGSTFYAGDFFLGDIFRGDLQRGTAAPFIDAPDGRNALGMSFD